jgi:hypothetical protein
MRIPYPPEALAEFAEGKSAADIPASAKQSFKLPSLSFGFTLGACFAVLAILGLVLLKADLAIRFATVLASILAAFTMPSMWGAIGIALLIALVASII